MCFLAAHSPFNNFYYFLYYFILFYYYYFYFIIIISIIIINIIIISFSFSFFFSSLSSLFLPPTTPPTASLFFHNHHHLSPSHLSFLFFIFYFYFYFLFSSPFPSFPSPIFFIYSLSSPNSQGRLPFFPSQSLHLLPPPLTPTRPPPHILTSPHGSSSPLIHLFFNYFPFPKHPHGWFPHPLSSFFSLFLSPYSHTPTPSFFLLHFFSPSSSSFDSHTRPTPIPFPFSFLPFSSSHFLIYLPFILFLSTLSPVGSSVSRHW